MPSSPDRRVLCCLSLILLCLCTPVVWGAERPAGELLANGGFESLAADGGPENWAVRTFGREEKFATAKASPGGRFGQRCLKIEGTSQPVMFGFFSHPVMLPEPTPDDLLLTVFYRTTGAPQADLSVTTFAEDFAAQEWSTPALVSEAVPLEHGPAWRSLSWRVHLLPSARQAVVMVRIHAAGSVFLDGMSLRPYPTDVECRVLKGGIVTALNGARRCQLQLTNHTAQALPVTVQLEATAPKSPNGGATARATLPPGQPHNLDVPYSYLLDRPHFLQVTVSGAQPDTIYDRQNLAVPGLLEGAVVSPAFRASLLPEVSASQVVVRGLVNATSDLRAKLRLQARLLGLGASSPEFGPDESGAWECSLPCTALLTGRYAAEVTAVHNGAVVAKISLPVTKPAGPPNFAAYDEKMRFWLNGKPHLPVGLYFALEEDDYTAAAEAGFNTLLLPSRLTSSRAMEAVQKLGLSALISSSATEQDFWRNAVNKYAPSEGLAGWYLIQRPGSQVPPLPPLLLGALYEQLVQLDPRHPVFLALDSPSRLAPYAPWCDVIMPWTEPEPAGDLRSVDAMLKRAMEVAGGRKPVMPVIQMTGAAWTQDARLDPAGNGRPPTPEEYRCMVYLALARGASGVFSYAYRVPQNRNQREYFVRRDAPQVWEMARKVGLELKALTPVFLEGDPVTLAVPEGPVALRGFRYKNVEYVLAVNTSNTTVPLSFKLEGLEGDELETAFDTRRICGPGGGQFADQLEPHAVRIYMGRRPLPPA